MSHLISKTAVQILYKVTIRSKVCKSLEIGEEIQKYTFLDMYNIHFKESMYMYSTVSPGLSTELTEIHTCKKF